MKFNYSDSYKDNPEHYRKFHLLDKFLEKLANENKDEFSKELYTSERFMAIGIGRNDIIYTPNPEMPEHIEKQIRKELKRLYPPKMNYKEARQAIFEYWEFTSPHMVNSEPVHMVHDCIFAPNKSNLQTLATIYNRMKDDHISNEDVLFDMGLNTDMRLYIVFQMKGSYWIVPLETYSEDNPFGNAGG